MVAVRNDLRHPDTHGPIGIDDALCGDWVLDRVSGLIDATPAIGALSIDGHVLRIEVRPLGATSARVLEAELNGGSAELLVAGERYCAQALIESDVLVWELEQSANTACVRVRRIMRPSKQGSELVAERVDMNADGMPTALRTEYWVRSRPRRIERGALAGASDRVS